MHAVSRAGGLWPTNTTPIHTVCPQLLLAAMRRPFDFRPMPPEPTVSVVRMSDHLSCTLDDAYSTIDPRTSPGR
jgi:hypothetical protein